MKEKERSIEEIAQLMSENNVYSIRVNPEDVIKFPDYDYSPNWPIKLPKDVYGARATSFIVLALLYADGEVDIILI